MGPTLRVSASNGDRAPGQIIFRADDPTLTGHADWRSRVSCCASCGWWNSFDAELSAVGRVAPVKPRRRGLSPGGLVVALAESQLIGGDCFDDIEHLRADAAGAQLRAVPATPSAPTARQLAYRFKPAHIRAIERAATRVGNDLDRKLGRDPGEEVTFDLDATESIVFGARKRGSGRSRQGIWLQQLRRHVGGAWSRADQRAQGRQPGPHQGRRVAHDARPREAALARRARADHGPRRLGFYAAELMKGLRARGCASRSRRRAPDDVGQARPDHRGRLAAAIDMHGAEVAEIPFAPDGWKHEPLRLIVRRVPVTAAELQATSPRARRRKTIPPEQLQMVLDGQLDSTYAYSFIVTDIPQHEQTTVAVEHFHRQRAQIEERFKDAKLGQALRHLPSGKLAANHLWLCCALLAMNITAWVCDISPAAGASATADRTCRCAATPRHCDTCSSASPPGSCAPRAKRSCACPPVSPTTRPSTPPTTPRSRSPAHKHSVALTLEDQSLPRRPAWRPSSTPDPAPASAA